MEKKKVTLSDLKTLLENKRAFTISSSSLPLSVEVLKRDRSREILVKHYTKKLLAWFLTWHSWQKRILICHIMGFCSKDQLELLATSLEPILHMDFSSSLLPPLQALHLDGVATFQIQRTITKRIANPEIIVNIESQEYLNSLPTTFHSVDTPVSSNISIATHLDESIEDASIIPRQRPRQIHRRDDSTKDKKSPAHKESISPVSRDPILPAIPLSHPNEHRNLRQGQSNFSDVSSLRRRRFSSVPDFSSTVGLLKAGRRKKDSGTRTRETSHARSKSVSAYSQHRAEHFREQLVEVGKWMENWEDVHKSYLLTEMVKLCDKNMLGYFVQCLYQHMKDQLSINSLPDSILAKIFSYLSPNDLFRCAQVCKSWNLFSNLPYLWREHTYDLGMREGIGNLAGVIETVVQHFQHSVSVEGQEAEVMGSVVDWKRTYIDLSRLILKMKDLVIETARLKDIDDLAKRIETTKKSEMYYNFSLKEMLDILRVQYSQPKATTHEVVRFAPESASTLRRKMRANRKASSKEPILKPAQKMDYLKISGASLASWSPSRNLDFAQNLMLQLRESKDDAYRSQTSPSHMEEEWLKWSRRNIEPLEEAQDTRPTVPHLPDPDGIRCFILAGGLLESHKIRPGYVQSIPRIRRLNLIRSMVLCLQCDSRKVVVGTIDKTVKVIDLRSGRSVSKLLGHKGSVQCLQFDDYKIVSGSWDTSVIVWDVVHFTPLKQLNGHVDCVSCLQFDENILVTGSYDGSLRIWSTSTWDHISIINGAHSDGVTCMTFNNRIIASGGNDKNIKLWSVSTYLSLGTLSHHQGPLSALGLSHLLLVSSSLHGDLIMWNLDSSSPILNRRLRNKVHFKKIAQFRNKFYGAGSDGLIYELDVSTGTCTRTLEGHKEAMTSLSINNHKIVSAGVDCTMLTWYFRKALRRAIREEEMEKERKSESAGKTTVETEDLEASEDDDDGEGDTEESDLTGDSQEHRYKSPKYFDNLPIRIVKTDSFENGFIPIPI